MIERNFVMCLIYIWSPALGLVSLICYYFFVIALEDVLGKEVGCFEFMYDEITKNSSA